MDINTQMFIGFLILEFSVFLPLIIGSLIGILVCKYKLRRIEMKRFSKRKLNKL